MQEYTGDNTQDIFNFIKSIKSNYPEDVKYDSVVNPFNYDKGLKDIDIKNINKKGSYVNIEYSKLQYQNIIKFSVEDVIVNLTIYTKDYLATNELKLIINRIYCMIKTFKSNITTNTINIYLYLYNCPRVITETYINSPNDFKGINDNDLFNCTNGYYRDSDNKILVTRLNTYKGLLTHELCHLCKLDFGGYSLFEMWNKDKVKYGKFKFSKFSEGINNAISSLIHSVFVSIEMDEDFDKIYYCEYKYSKDMVGNLLHYFKCDKINRLKECGYNQDGMVFEYVILRYVYLEFIDKLFHFRFEKEGKEKEYYSLFIKCLDQIADKEFKFNDKMIIKDTNTDINLVRMEYYLF